MTGVTSVRTLLLILNSIWSLWLSWSPPLFSSENTPLSYHIYIENQHCQLLYNDITNDTSYELYNLTVCDIYTATVIAHNGEYSSSNVTIQIEYSGGMLIILYSFELNKLLLQSIIVVFFLITRSLLMNIIIPLMWNSMSL